MSDITAIKINPPVNRCNVVLTNELLGVLLIRTQDVIKNNAQDTSTQDAIKNSVQDM
ncbi:MAG: hypothetical protein ABIP51_01120 [Bacteroidia bacterium]